MRRSKNRSAPPRSGKFSHVPPTPDIGKDGGPNLLSHAALVYDQTSGRLLYAKNADTITPIASITKLMTAMVVFDAKLALDEAITLDSQDIDMIKGSRSRLPVGTAFRREDLLRLALMASDNRAAAALGRTYPGGTLAAVEAMASRVGAPAFSSALPLASVAQSSISLRWRKLRRSSTPA